MMQALVSMYRVITALILREARVRHGRARLGYFWAILEPALLIGFLTLLFSSFRAQSVAGADFAVFFATGVLPFQLYRNTSQYVSASHIANRPLFNYQLVKPIDAAIARAILDVSTHLLVIVLVLGGQIWLIHADFPGDIPRMLLSLALLAVFAFGAGLNLSAARAVVPSVLNLYLVVMGGAFFLSGVFFPLSSVPTFYREILLWNPLVHGVEGFRTGYFLGYRSPDLDLGYLGLWALTTVFTGMILSNLVKEDTE